MAYEKQQWDTTSYVNPTRMNHIEDGIKANSDAVDQNASDISLISSDLQGQIDEVNSNLEKYITWKHWGATAGESVGGNGQPLDLPSDFNELCIIAYTNGILDSENTKRYIFNIPKVVLSTEYTHFENGHVYSSYEPNQGSIGISVSFTKIKCNWASTGTADTSSSYYLDVFYR